MNAKDITPQVIASRVAIAALQRKSDPIADACERFNVSREIVELCIRDCAIVEKRVRA